MFHLIERLRKKNKTERQRLAISIAAVITGVIFLLWALSFFTSIKSMQSKSDTGNPSGFNSSLDSFREASKILQDGIGDVRNQMKEINSEINKTINNETDNGELEGGSTLEYTGQSEQVNLPETQLIDNSVSDGEVILNESVITAPTAN